MTIYCLQAMKNNDTNIYRKEPAEFITKLSVISAIKNKIEFTINVITHSDRHKVCLNFIALA